MYDPERGWSFSFAGCGFLLVYHAGVTRCLSERAPHLLRDSRMFFGSSSGALHCAAFLAGISAAEQITEVLARLAQRVWKWNLGVLHPSSNLSMQLRKDLHELLPTNVHQLVSGKMCISLTRISNMQTVLVSDFQSKEEVVDVLVCACFIPFYCGLIPPSFRGVRYIDGGITDNMPFSDANTTITVSPFYGKHDICPKAKSTNFLHVNIKNLGLYLCSENAYLLFRALMPPDAKELGEVGLQGYLDTLRFLEEQGICIKPMPSLNLPSEERESKAFQLHESRCGYGDNTAGVCTRPRLSLNLSLEERELEVIAPSVENMSLEAPGEATPSETWSKEALNAAMKDRGDYVSEMMTFFSLRTVSYVVLPCMLPVVFAVALLQRLVICFQYIPDGIQWLQWASTQIYSQVMASLHPTTRCQTPAPGHQASAHEPDHD